MKSLCIKTNNDEIIAYLQESFENINLEDTYISIRKFKHFNNIIIHYKGIEYNTFCNYVSNVITKCIIKFVEHALIYSLVSSNYFYFNSYEKNKVLNNTLELLLDTETHNTSYDFINNEIYKNIINSHSLYLQGIINFKLNNYIEFLNKQIEIAVNKFLIDKEYLEFVDILRLYIKSESEFSNIEHLHLIYKNKCSIIIDDNKDIITYNNIKKNRYISDISFSSNDLALNTLLGLVPKSITIHLIDGCYDEFINTLKLIFQEKIKICEECDICSMYKHKHLNKL